MAHVAPPWKISKFDSPDSLLGAVFAVSCGTLRKIRRVVATGTLQALGRGPSVLRAKITLRKIRSRSVIIQRTEETMTALMALAFFLGCAAPVSATEVLQAGQDKAQITILYDAFGKDPAMQKDWGYAALVEYGGKRILFDTGNNPDILAQNAKSKGIDLSKLDFAVMSHRHGDHMGGLAYLLKVNPTVKIYAPKEGFGVYGADLPSTFIGRILLSQRNSATTTVRHRRSCDLGRRGPERIFNSSKKIRRLPQAST
jgi:hypothetical protein